MLQIVKSCEGDEFLSYYPKWSQLFATVEKHFLTFCARIQFLASEEEKVVMTLEESEALAKYLEWKGDGASSCLEYFRDSSVSLHQVELWLNLTTIEFPGPVVPSAPEKKGIQPMPPPAPATPLSSGQATPNAPGHSRKKEPNIPEQPNQFKASEPNRKPSTKPAFNKGPRPSGHPNKNDGRGKR